VVEVVEKVLVLLEEQALEEREDLVEVVDHMPEMVVQEIHLQLVQLKVLEAVVEVVRQLLQPLVPLELVVVEEEL
tara:strand:- start:264 stop:488 length:225 start_codon:yes stop_codon:yes gene_type:complete